MVRAWNRAREKTEALAGESVRISDWVDEPRMASPLSLLVVPEQVVPDQVLPEQRLSRVFVEDADAHGRRASSNRSEQRGTHA